ncbi:MAG: class I SAM-dependent methyltransferase [Pseudomonadota bacterium]
MSIEADSIPDLYERHAAVYDQGRGRDLMEKTWLDRLLTLTVPPRSVLDLGCGSGEPIAHYLIDQGCELTGIDSSPTLIGLCRRRFPSHRWTVTDMRSLSLNRQFQGIIAWDSFFHLRPSDQERMFSVFRRHAAPKATLMFTSGPGRGVAIGTYQNEPLYHASLDASEYKKLLNDNGFNVVAHRVEDPDCGRHTVWLAQQD